MEIMSSKSKARNYLEKFGIEMVPGYSSETKDLNSYLKEAKKLVIQ